VDYMSGRSEEAFLEWLNEKCGTFRAAGGNLSPLAGRVPSLDTLASQFYSTVADGRGQLLEKAMAAAGLLETAHKTSGDYYLRAMQKMSGSSDWLQKESTRLASILSKKTLAPAKLDEIQRKANILASFIEQKSESAMDEAADSAQHVFAAGSDGAKGAASSISSAAQEGASTVIAAAKGGASAAKGGASTVSSAAEEGASTVISAAKGGASTVSSAAQEGASTVSSAAQDGASTVISAAKGGASSVSSVAHEGASTVSSAAKGGASTASSAAKEGASSVSSAAAAASDYVKSEL